MSFTYPILLWGLTALAIPIIIHLFNFRKAKRVSFSNVRFLESVKKKNASNLRLKHLLILFCRLLFIFFLILTFAQPFIPSKEEGLKSRSVTVYLDNSHSLSNLTDRDISGFNELVGIASEITNLYPAETRFNLFTNDFIQGSKIASTQAKTAERLTELNYSNLSREGEEILRKIQTSIQAEAQDIFILSDFQQSTFGQFDNYIDSTNAYHFVKTETPEEKNISIDTIYLANPFLVPNQKNSVLLTINNQGPAINDLRVKFFVNEKQSGTSTIDIEENTRANLTFELSGSLSKINRCLISFEDFPVTFDNDFYFTLNQASRINIVEIADQLNSPVSKVYKDHALFAYTHFHPTNISYPNLESADLLILNGLTKLGNGLAAQVEKHLSQGKSVIFIPRGGDAYSYSLSGLTIEKDSTGTKIPLAAPDIKNPFFENIFESLSKDTQMPEVTPIYSWRGRERVLLRTKTGAPFLSQLMAKGNLYLMATPLSSSHTNFHLHALFVPVMQRIAELSSINNQALAYNIDETNITLAVDSIPDGQLYKLVRSESELIPSQRVNANELILDMPRYLLSPGYYDLMLGEEVVTAIAFNHAKAESDLATWSTDEVEARFSGIKNLNLYQSQESGSFSKIMKEKYHRREIWKYTLILSLIFLFAESVLIRLL